MKFTNLLNATIAATILFASGKALAAAGQVSITATIKEQNTNSVSHGVESDKVKSVTLNNAQIYALISIAAANAGTNGTGILSTNLPSNGFIAFDPNGNDGNVNGTFYVTNKSGLNFPLSGLDTNGNYYSFIELDTYNPGAGAGAIDLGFSDNFNGIQSGSFNGTNGTGSEAITSTALLYVHDNPYSFNDGNNADEFYSNNNAFEIRGIAQMNLTFKTNAVTKWSISLQGTGNAIIDNNQDSIVTSGKMTASQ